MGMGGALEKYLMKAAGGLGKGVGMAKGAGEWAMREHPMASGALAGGLGTMGLQKALADDPEENEHPDEEEDMSLLKRLGII